MKGKFLGSLFALPFLCVGLWMGYSIAATLAAASAMQDWAAVEARLTRAGFDTSSGDDSDTYKAYADYTYQWQGQQYRGTRVGLSGGFDNIGSWQQDTGRRLSRALRDGGRIEVFIDPDNPSESIIDRSIRWGLMGFKAIFFLVFGGIGAGLLYAIWFYKKPEKTDDPAYRDAPWLANEKWRTPTMYSSSKASMWLAWGFAAFWNLISAPLPFLLYEEVVDKGNTIALVGLLFPLVGLGLIVWAIRRTLEWRKFGASPVTLDPFPGAIGGHVGGTIALRTPYDSNARFSVTLTNVHSHYSGSGKNRSRKESAEWQDTVVAHAAAGATGTTLTFRFDVPDGLDPSDAVRDGDDYHLWRLNISADLPGADLDRDFEIPVYPTGEQSRHLSDRAVREGRHVQAGIDEHNVLSVLQLSTGVTGKRLLYPMGRHLGAALVGFLIGAIFAGAGWWVIVDQGSTVFGSIFAGVGGLIALMCLYMILNSLEVTLDGGTIHSVRRLLGLPVSRKSMQRSAFARFDKDATFKTHSGSKHVIHYTIYAVDGQGNKLTVGEGFRGDNEARAAMRVIAREFGLKIDDESRQSRASNLGSDFDVLAADG